MEKIELDKNIRIYNPAECAVFCKVKEQYGGCSNMAPGFNVVVNDIEIRTVEALYQACRFPEHWLIQKNIISQRSPMAAKMVGKPHRKTLNRKDWKKIELTLMRWCLRVKLLQNWESFLKVFEETGDMPIVEKSTKGDDKWGTIVIVEKETAIQETNVANRRKSVKYVESAEMPIGSLVGYNGLGRLLMELRENVKTGSDPMSHDFMRLEPLPIEKFWLFEHPIREILRK